MADIFQKLKPEERRECFLKLDEEKAADVIEYLPPQLQVEILGDIDESLASRLISKLPHDDAADVLGDMEDDDSELYLEKLPEKFSSELRELLTYNENTAEGGFTTLGTSASHIISVKTAEEVITPMADEFLPSEVDELIMNSSTTDSTKKFKITVDDSGTLKATEAT